MTVKGFSGKWLFWGVFALLALAALVYTVRPEPVWVDLAPVSRGPLEITIKDPDYEAVVAKDAANAHRVLKEWTEKTRALKERNFGAAALDLRGIDMSKTDFSKIKNPSDKDAQQ